MSYICPVCGKSLARKASLAAHMAKIHPEAKFEAPDVTETPAAPEGDVQELKLEVPAAVDQTYHCIECGHSGIAKGTPACPGCGVALDWGQLNA